MRACGAHTGSADRLPGYPLDLHVAEGVASILLPRECIERGTARRHGMRSRIARWLRSLGVGAGHGRARRLRVDLERRGVPAALADAVSERLELRAAALDAVAYQAVLDATCTAWGAQRKVTPPDAALEIQRLVQDFAVELQKLDEGLRLLSTYLLRIRDRARSDESVRLVH